MSSSPPVDPAAIRAGLERQLALLHPVTEHLREAAHAPSPLVADDWRGPAAEAAGRFLDELRRELRIAADTTSDEVRRLRVELARLL
jgi:hypothetical protein